MEFKTNIIQVDSNNIVKSCLILSATLVCSLVLLLLSFGTIQAQTEWPNIAYSKDWTPISYETCGTG
jgi:hypothetical protein